MRRRTATGDGWQATAHLVESVEQQQIATGGSPQHWSSNQFRATRTAQLTRFNELTGRTVVDWKEFETEGVRDTARIRLRVGWQKIAKE